MELSNNIFGNKNSFMLGTPTNFKDSVDYYTRNLQNKINDVWKYASDNYEIEYEDKWGTQEYIPLVCRVTKAISPKTGKNLGDDFKKLIFTDLNRDVVMGSRYIFQDSVWIVSNTDDYKYTSKSAVVRRCNNVAKWMDKDGFIYEEPCILGYELQYDNVYYNNVIEIPQGTTVMRLQNNEISQKLQLNDRVIFGSSVYKIHSKLDSLRNNTFDANSVPIIEFGIYIDAISPYDDFVNQIAYNGEIEEEIDPYRFYQFMITPDDTTILQNETTVYTCKIYEFGIETNRKFTFKDISTVPYNAYTFNIIDDNSFSIRNYYRYDDAKVIIKISGVDFDFSKEIKFRLGGWY